MPRAPLGLHLSEHGAGRVAAVLGRPIDHSLSPLLHTAAYAALGLSGWRFERIDCGAEELPAVLASAGPTQAGFAVTMPAKRAALAAANDVGAVAAATGAANTLLPKRHGWRAENTDVAGIATTLQQHAPPTRDASTVVLGAGGTAQAALVALAGLGVRAVALVVRDPSRADEATATAQRSGLELSVHQMDAVDLLRSCDLLISTVPAQGAAALADIQWSPRLVALDVIYPNWPTPLATSVAAAGGRAISGAHVLLHQAAAQVELMTGRSAPVEAMRAALRTQVGAALDGP